MLFLCPVQFKRNWSLNVCLHQQKTATPIKCFEKSSQFEKVQIRFVQTYLDLKTIPKIFQMYRDHSSPNIQALCLHADTNSIFRPHEELHSRMQECCGEPQRSALSRPHSSMRWNQSSSDDTEWSMMPHDQNISPITTYHNKNFVLIADCPKDMRYISAKL
jgi:hypothetical protein